MENPHPESLAVLLADPPPDRQAYIDGASEYAVWASKRHFDLERARRFAAASYDRAFYPEGASRQMTAILASGDRAGGLSRLRRADARDPRLGRRPHHPVGRTANR